MIITLMKNTDSEITVSKTPETVKTVTGVLRAPTSVVSPRITLSVDGATATACNYVHIPELGRYYYVTDCTSLNGGTWEFSLHVDVLKTYADEIREQTAVIERQEKTWNVYLNDPDFQIYANPQITTQPFPRPFHDFQTVLLIAGGSGLK